MPNQQPCPHDLGQCEHAIPEGWKELKIEIESSKDGKLIPYTLDQMFNDWELGNALARDIGLPNNRHEEALNWMRKNVKKFVALARSEAREEVWQNLLDQIILNDGVFSTFTAEQWKYLKKILYPLTHESVRDFIPASNLGKEKN